MHDKTSLTMICFGDLLRNDVFSEMILKIILQTQKVIIMTQMGFAIFSCSKASQIILRWNWDRIRVGKG